MNILLVSMMTLMVAFHASGVCAAEVVQNKRLTLFGDYLYWYASEQTDAVWANDIGFPSTNHVTYSAPNMQFNWSSGFKGGLSYAIPHFWDVTFVWTHVPTNKGLDYHVPDTHLMTPQFFSGYLSGDTFTSASIDWKIILNAVDLVMSHPFQVAQSITIRPSIGVKAATINQTIHSLWHATLLSVPIYTSSEVVTNHYTGMGPELGVNGNWNFYQHFSLIGDVSSALMWGRWNIEDTYKRPTALLGFIQGKNVNTSMRNSKLGAPMFQAFFGLQWVHETTYQMKFKLGYEMQYWANQLQAPTFQLLPLHGDLTLQGGTCGISINL